MKVCNLVSYTCLKCSDPVALEIRTNMQVSTLDLWRDMFDSKLCLDCHCDKRVPLLAKCMVH